jgi:hypothetical protein
MLPCVGREHYRLSVTDSCRWPGGDETSMLFRVSELLVNIAHFPKLYLIPVFRLGGARCPRSRRRGKAVWPNSPDGSRGDRRPKIGPVKLVPA